MRDERDRQKKQQGQDQEWERQQPRRRRPAKPTIMSDNGLGDANDKGRRPKTEWVGIERNVHGVVATVTAGGYAFVERTDNPRKADIFINALYILINLN